MYRTSENSLWLIAAEKHVFVPPQKRIGFRTQNLLAEYSLSQFVSFTVLPNVSESRTQVSALPEDELLRVSVEVVEDSSYDRVDKRKLHPTLPFGVLLESEIGATLDPRN